MDDPVFRHLGCLKIPSHPWPGREAQQASVSPSDAPGNSDRSGRWQPPGASTTALVLAGERLLGVEGAVRAYAQSSGLGPELTATPRTGGGPINPFPAVTGGAVVAESCRNRVACRRSSVTPGRVVPSTSSPSRSRPWPVPSGPCGALRPPGRAPPGSPPVSSPGPSAPSATPSPAPSSHRPSSPSGTASASPQPAPSAPPSDLGYCAGNGADASRCTGIASRLGARLKPDRTRFRGGNQPRLAVSPSAPEAAAQPPPVEWPRYALM